MTINLKSKKKKNRQLPLNTLNKPFRFHYLDVFIKLQDYKQYPMPTQKEKKRIKYMFNHFSFHIDTKVQRRASDVNMNRK